MRWIATIILVLILPKLFYKSGALVAFESNRTYMAKVFCVNKDKVDLKCNGQCHLAEMLAQEEQDSPDSPIVPSFLEMTWNLPEDIIEIDHSSIEEIGISKHFYRLERWGDIVLGKQAPPPRS